MNLLDPMRPDRLYRLDLRRNDHREWAKILVYLAVNDPVRARKRKREKSD
jgi:hypothetical protein